MQFTGAAANNTQALSTTDALLALWSALATNANLSYDRSDVSVKPDKANNRIVVTAPGLYRVRLYLVCSVNGTPVLTFSFRKGGTVVANVPKGQITCVSGSQALIMVEAEIQVNAADLPAAGGVDAYPDPPAGGVIGAAFAPKTGVALDVVVKVSTGTPTLTLIEGSFSAERLS